MCCNEGSSEYSVWLPELQRMSSSGSAALAAKCLMLLLKDVNGLISVRISAGFGSNGFGFGLYSTPTVFGFAIKCCCCLFYLVSHYVIHQSNSLLFV